VLNHSSRPAAGQRTASPGTATQHLPGRARVRKNGKSNPDRHNSPLNATSNTSFPTNRSAANAPTASTIHALIRVSTPGRATQHDHEPPPQHPALRARLSARTPEPPIGTANPTTVTSSLTSNPVVSISNATNSSAITAHHRRSPEDPRYSHVPEPDPYSPAVPGTHRTRTSRASRRVEYH